MHTFYKARYVERKTAHSWATLLNELILGATQVLESDITVVNLFNQDGTSFQLDERVLYAFGVGKRF